MKALVAGPSPRNHGGHGERFQLAMVYREAPVGDEMQDHTESSPKLHQNLTAPRTFALVSDLQL